MGAGQRETGFDVVEIHRVFCLGHSRMDVEQHEQREAQHREGADPERNSEVGVSVCHRQAPRLAI